MRARLAILIMAGSAALGGCAYGMGGYGSPFGGLSIGVGYGNGYGGYGYGRDCYDPYSPYGGYGYGGYDRYGFPYGGSGYGSCGYGYSPFGWYDGFYYPGSGFYVYDQYRRRHVWSDAQKRYWSERVERARRTDGAAAQPTREDWSGFRRQRTDRVSNQDRTVRSQRFERIRTQAEGRRVEREERTRTPARERSRDSDEPRTQPE